MGCDQMRWRVVEHWQRFEPEFVPAICRPCCFACGYDRLANLTETDSRAVAKARWNSASFLQCAHIIAASVGGPREPENLLLLCKRCHTEAPMLRNPRRMLEWARNRPFILDYWVAGIIAGVGTVPSDPEVDFNGLLPLLRHLGADKHPHLAAGTLPSSLVLAVREYIALHRAGFEYHPQPPKAIEPTYSM